MLGAGQRLADDASVDDLARRAQVDRHRLGLAAAVGAMFGSAIPISRQEQEKLGDIGEKARDMASEQKDRMTEKLRDKKDDLVEKADHKMKDGQSADSRAEESKQPFMIPEQTR